MAENPEFDMATLLAGVTGDANGAISPPIVQSSLFAFKDYQAFEDRLSGHTDTAIYTRVQNPTVAAFETLMAQAENGEAAVGFASGMAAISSSLLAFVRPGDRIACVEHVYGDAYRLFERMLRPLGIDTTYHSMAEIEADEEVIRGARLIYLESPNSLVFQTLNLRKVAERARRLGILTMIDNSWATPVFQRPLDLGIDIVVHSASKYISGHSDTVAGVAISRCQLIDQIRNLSLSLLGGKLAPFEAWLLVRGLRTLDARMHHHQTTADYFVERLADLVAVRQLHFPSLDSTSPLSGRSGLLSVEFDSAVDIPRFCDALKHFKIGVSWGGFESLILPARAALAQAKSPHSMLDFGISPGLVRLSLGLENRELLWTDFQQAVNKGIA